MLKYPQKTTQMTFKNSINLKVSLLVKASTLPRAPHHEGSTVAVVVKPLLSGAKEEVRCFAETGSGLITERRRLNIEESERTNLD